jgi:uncharacterized protein YdaU (DUF1376 family)
VANADIWMPLYIGDYLADTSRLTTEQHGAYLLLIMDYWRNGPPPDNAQVLAQITRMSADAWSNAQAMLSSFFSVKGGFWHHDRIDSELVAAKANKEKATAKASAAASARWGKQSKDAPSNATSTPQAMHEECPSPSPSPSTNQGQEQGIAGAIPKAKADAKGSNLPVDWQPSPDDERFCRQERPDLSITATADRFRDHWIAKPGAAGRKTDWSATWRNWVRSERARPPPSGRPEKFDPVAFVNQNRITQ